MLQAVDSDESGFIDYTEFLIAAMDRNRLLSKERLEAAFLAFDRDGSGAISSDELKEMLGEENIEDGVWDLLINTVD
jgi:calcium-dependent protein kinase